MPGAVIQLLREDPDLGENMPPQARQQATEAITDPAVPPLPPHIRFEQAQKMAKALPGDPHTGRIIKQSFKGKLEEFVTR